VEEEEEEDEEEEEEEGCCGLLCVRSTRALLVPLPRVEMVTAALVMSFSRSSMSAV
jgi:hypothetical protein